MSLDLVQSDYYLTYFDMFFSVINYHCYGWQLAILRQFSVAVAHLPSSEQSIWIVEFLDS